MEKEKKAKGSHEGFMSVDSTRLRSQVGVGFNTRRKVLVRPFRNFMIRGWVKTEQLSTGGRKALIITRCTCSKPRNRSDVFNESKGSVRAESNIKDKTAFPRAASDLEE